MLGMAQHSQFSITKSKPRNMLKTPLHANARNNSKWRYVWQLIHLSNNHSIPLHNNALSSCPDGRCWEMQRISAVRHFKLSGLTTKLLKNTPPHSKFTIYDQFRRPSHAQTLEPLLSVHVLMVGVEKCKESRLSDTSNSQDLRPNYWKTHLRTVFDLSFGACVTGISLADHVSSLNSLTS